jgi:uridylate kinase
MRRVLIKISGEAISNSDCGFDFERISGICEKIKNVISEGIGVSFVVGGGNIIRGRDFAGTVAIRQETADSVGMLATVMNGIVVRDILRSNGVATEIVSPLRLPFDILQADHFTISKLITEGNVIMFCGGTGLPYFSTDTISVVAAFMSQCDAILKATKTDGIYDKDPAIHNDAIQIPNLTYQKAISRNLKIMDRTAFALAEQRGIPIHIFREDEPDCFLRSINKSIKQSIVSAVDENFQ